MSVIQAADSRQAMGLRSQMKSNHADVRNSAIIHVYRSTVRQIGCYCRAYYQLVSASSEAADHEISVRPRNGGSGICSIDRIYCRERYSRQYMTFYFAVGECAICPDNRL